ASPMSTRASSASPPVARSSRSTRRPAPARCSRAAPWSGGAPACHPWCSPPSVPRSLHAAPRALQLAVHDRLVARRPAGHRLLVEDLPERDQHAEVAELRARAVRLVERGQALVLGGELGHARLDG